MPELPQKLTGLKGDDTVVERPRRAGWKVNLRTLFLLVAAIAVWMTVVINRRHNETLEARIAVMRPMVRELEIDDPAKIALVSLEPRWYDDHQWEVYLPDGSYRVALATRGVGEEGLAPVKASAKIGPGRHRISLELKESKVKAAWVVDADWDGVEQLTAEEPKEWNSDRGSSGGGDDSLEGARLAVLFRRRFVHHKGDGVWSTPEGPSEGILLWIERIDQPDATPEVRAPELTKPASPTTKSGSPP
ncbi:hypothetical protein ACYOEI_17455 [Singulisphaera rosea]